MAKMDKETGHPKLKKMLGRLVTKVFWWLLSRGWLPDSILRWKIRQGLEGLMAKMDKEADEYGDRVALESDFVAEIRKEEIAVCQDEANQQHYEVPAEFFRIVLGPHLKYSCGLFRSSSATLTEAEEAMLEVYVERAQLKDGMDLLDLGCGWGSVALFLAARYKSVIYHILPGTYKKVLLDVLSEVFSFIVMCAL